ncbi:hypothetical protein GF326_04285 [Candidatus Bathyarchaeota archaeon]|nr:hypothetical protein [Candidatus Bathyarchaeota archaeon]
MAGDELRELIASSIHLADGVVNDHFGRVEDIRNRFEDREEVEYTMEMKIRSYETVLKELMRWKLGKMGE